MKQYSTPTLIEYGEMSRLTQGTSTPLPDIDQSGNTAGTGCPTDTFAAGGITFRRTSCSVVTDPS